MPMRFTIFIFCLCLHFVPLLTRAQTLSYDSSLTLAIAEFDGIKDMGACNKLFEKFEQLNKSNNKDWLPSYYAALVKIKMSMFKDKDADKYADESIDWILASKRIQSNDEVLCVESLAYSTKMSIHPSWRWFAYEQKIRQPLQLAKKINSNNPRIYVLEAVLQHRLPPILGGSCKTAKQLAIKAERLLMQQNDPSFKKPHWGKKLVTEIINGCRF